MTCIKCGKEIPEGELFCASCSLNLQTEAEERLGTVRPPAPSGRMQKPVPVRRTPPQPMGPQVQANGGKHGLIICKEISGSSLLQLCQPLF